MLLLNKRKHHLKITNYKTSQILQFLNVNACEISALVCLWRFTCTLARTTSMGLVMVEAVAAAIGPATACRSRWGHSLGAINDSCSENQKGIMETAQGKCI